MTDKWFSGRASSGAFFRKIDWSAFWAATVIAFLVYFFTLGPSVTLEDSGELAVAGDHLGVPHPPGYPIWTMCAWLFARVFSFVTFRGQPTPVWSISLMSAVFAALAAGLTAMLISRSVSDMLRDAHDGDPDFKQSENDWLCWVGGVAGALIFAFSPVMWSQATIVEVYTLNAFFLMWIFLLSYRWMRQPSQKILWLTAFVFGLGLTNYQVLLLAALPLVIVIFLRDIALFRDFLLVGIPVLLTSHALQIGSMLPAAPGGQATAYAKFTPLQQTALPSQFMLWGGVILLMVAIVIFMAHNFIEHYCAKKAECSPKFALPSARITYIGAGIGLSGALLMLLACISNKVLPVDPLNAPLLPPGVYTSVAALVMATLVFSLAGARSWKGSCRKGAAAGWLGAALVSLVVLLIRLAAVEGAQIPQQYMGVPFDWTLPRLILVGGLAVLFVIAATIERGIFFALPVAAVQIALFTLLNKGAMNGLHHPTTWWFWWPVIWNFVLLAMADMLLPHGRTVSLTMLFAELGVSFYAYMPLVSDLRNPPMNWGYPRTWEGFKHAITRGQYEKLAPSDVFTSKFLFQIGTYFADMRVQFTMLVAPLGFLPFTLWSFKKGHRRIRVIYIAAVLYVMTFVLVALSNFVGTDVEVPLRLDKLIVALTMLLFAVGLITIMWRQVENFVLTKWKGHDLSEGVTAGITFAFLYAVIVLFFTKGFISFASHSFNSQTGQVSSLPVSAAQKSGALLLALVLVTLILAALFFVRRVLERKIDFRPDMDDVTQQWMLAVASGFFVMSVVLVALANIKGDLQDNFIQKVKFISSHVLFVIWVGYGLAFGLVIANRLLKYLVKLGHLKEVALPPFRVALCCLGMFSALIPIYENYTNDELVFAMSGAEQNGHTFGWQFGNYQLRGADAITEELEADEEPLPNPVYPAEMTKNAIFFGGTDPGRFVPTYMIYSADVRPDVFLITQNALADNTYMSTMRDLYGDEIWIPTPEDSAKAFQIYVDEVKSGKRAANADLTIDGGRVQVSGALGVMEINGILCDMIFAKNKSRHDFYIEESYVIRWMYPYLTPHGLIMKINQEKTELSERLIRDDMEFWDWYTRKLTRDPAFRRDLPAQKSFSKLRSAIAGLYSNRRRLTECEEAYREARVLYPLSPEASFRMLQELLLPQARYSEAEDILAYFVERDPNNQRAEQFLEFVSRVHKKQQRIEELVELGKKQQKLSPEHAFELAMSYKEIGQNQSAAHYLKRIADNKGAGLALSQRLDVAFALCALQQHKEAVRVADSLINEIPADSSVNMLLKLADVYKKADVADQYTSLLMRVLKLKPGHWQAWIDIAEVYRRKGQTQQMQYALQKGVSIGQSQALQVIEKNPELKKVAIPIIRRMFQQNPPDIPAVRLGH